MSAYIPQKPQSLKNVLPALVGLPAVFLPEMLDNSILNIAVPTIGRELHASDTAPQWITNATIALAFRLFEDDKLRIRTISAMFGTITIILTIALPVLFVNEGSNAWLPWATSGVAYKSAAGLTMAGLGYMISLQLQLGWGWSPISASLGMLPLVITLLAAGFVVEKFINQAGNQLGTSAYIFAAIALFTSSITKGYWTATRTTQFHHAVLFSTLILAIASVLLIGWAFMRTHKMIQKVIS